MDPTKPATPISYPLTSLEQLENRSYFSSFHFAFNKCSVPLPRSRTPTSHENRPRLLVCHDMKGGYQDDKWVQGGSNCKAYSLWHWHLIDIFVYFSHSLVTLPPPCWMNAAHKHGVQVLGTFITEWSEGAAICNTLLASKEISQMYASRLAELAAVLGFDGWLINIENKVKPKDIVNLKEFVNHLTATMHNLVPGSLVIWYDSVTEEGKLEWQDCLNDKNKCFFDLCDGIFTNYTWKENYPTKCAAIAGERRYDVYMGVDVFGRNTYGGGGFQSNVALKAAKDANVSAALFAPGWVYETNQGPTFQRAQNRWWELVSNCWPSAQRYPFELPLFSNFDQGYGKGMHANGRSVSRAPWNNISCQNLQPLLHTIVEPKDEFLQVIVSYEDIVFDGGCCTKFFGELGDQAHCLTMLYNGIATINGSSLFISYSVKTDANSGFFLLFKVSNHQGTKVICLVDSQNSYEHQMISEHGSTIVFKVPSTTFQKIVSSHEWSIREYIVDVEESSLQSIYAVSFLDKLDYLVILDLLRKFNMEALTTTTICTTPRTSKATSSRRVPYQVLLGHLRISSQNHGCFQQLSLHGHKVSWGETAVGERLLSMMLSWHLQGSENSKISKYYIYSAEELDAEVGIAGKGPEYLGVAVVEAFYVSELSVHQECKTVRFYLQAFCSCGIYQDLDAAPQLAVKVPSAGAGVCWRCAVL